jgi:hypothetical protein
MGRASAHENHMLERRTGGRRRKVGEQFMSDVQFDHDARLFDEVTMAQEVCPYD